MPRPSEVVAETATDAALVATHAAGRAGTPDKPRRLLRGDLDTIVGTALKKDPAERYASVAALADDLRRHLRHEPISARRDTLGYRAIVLGGYSNAAGTSDFALARYNPDGGLDTTFGTRGQVLTNFGGRGDDDAYAMSIDELGRILLAGHSSAGGTSDFALARYNAQGILDGTFGSGGLVLTDFSGAGSDDGVYGLAVDARRNRHLHGRAKHQAQAPAGRRLVVFYPRFPIS